MKLRFFLDNKQLLMEDTLTYSEFIKFVKKEKPLSFEYTISHPDFHQMNQKIDHKSWPTCLQLIKVYNGRCHINCVEYDIDIFSKPRDIRIKIFYLGEEITTTGNTKMTYKQLHEIILTIAKKWDNIPENPTFRQMKNYKFIRYINNEASWKEAVHLLTDNEIHIHIPDPNITEKDIEEIKNEKNNLKPKELSFKRE